MPSYTRKGSKNLGNILANIKEEGKTPSLGGKGGGSRPAASFHNLRSKKNFSRTRVDRRWKGKDSRANHRVMEGGGGSAGGKSTLPLVGNCPKTTADELTRVPCQKDCRNPPLAGGRWDGRAQGAVLWMTRGALHSHLREAFTNEKIVIIHSQEMWF